MTSHTELSPSLGQSLLKMYHKFHQQGRRLILVALLLGFLTTFLAWRLAAPAPIEYNRLGIHLLLDDGRQIWDQALWPQHLDAAQELLGAGYVIQVLSLDTLSLDKWQTFLDLCHERDLQPIFRLATTYNRDSHYWEIPDSDYVPTMIEFLTALNWHTDEKRLIFLNEVNRGNEWGGQQPDPAAYARLFRTFAESLPTGEGYILLNSAFDLYAPSTGDQLLGGFQYVDAETYLDALYAADADLFSLIDEWNSHPYPLGAFRQPPWEQEFKWDQLPGLSLTHTTPPDNIYNRGINAYTWELWKLSTYGIDPLPVVITETGWRHAEAALDSLDAGDDYPTLDQITAYLDMAMRGNFGQYSYAPRTGWTPWLSDPRVKILAPFALNGHPDEWGHTNWLIINPDGQITGTYAHYELVKNFPK